MDAYASPPRRQGAEGYPALASIAPPPVASPPVGLPIERPAVPPSRPQSPVPQPPWPQRPWPQSPRRPRGGLWLPPRAELDDEGRVVLAFLLDRMRDALPVPAAAILLVQGRALTTVAADGLALAVGEDAAPLLGSEAAAMLAAPELGQWAVADLHRVGGQGADVGTGIGTPPVPGALRALLGVSLYVEGRRVGVLAAGEAERRSWTREDLSLVAGLAPVAEGELRRARREQHQRAAGNASRPCLAADNPTPRASSHTAGEAGEERAITGADPARRTGKPRLRPVPGGIAPGT